MQSGLLRQRELSPHVTRHTSHVTRHTTHVTHPHKHIQKKLHAFCFVIEHAPAPIKRSTIVCILNANNQNTIAVIMLGAKLPSVDGLTKRDLRLKGGGGDRALGLSGSAGNMLQL